MSRAGQGEHSVLSGAAPLLGRGAWHSTARAGARGTREEGAFHPITHGMTRSRRSPWATRKISFSLPVHDALSLSLVFSLHRRDGLLDDVCIAINKHQSDASFARLPDVAETAAACFGLDALQRDAGTAYRPRGWARL